MFIVQLSQETELWVNMIILLGRWSSKGWLSGTLGRLHIYCTGLLRGRTLSWYSSLAQKMVWRRLHVHWTVSWETGLCVAMIVLLETCSWKFLNQWHCGSLYVHCSDLLGDRASNQYNSFTRAMVLKGCFAWYWGRLCSACLLFRSFWRKSWVGTIVLFGRWSWNDYSLVTLGKRLHFHCSCILGDSIRRVILIGYFWNDRPLGGDALGERLNSCCGLLRQGSVVW